MSYQLIDADLPSCKGACPKVIFASGTIGQNEYLQFASFIEEASKKVKLSSLLLIESPGGFRGGAAGLGVLLRKTKMKVMVGRPTGAVVTATSGLTGATCASACVLVLAGGVSRSYVPGSRIGVHRSHTGQDVLDPITRQKVNGTVNHDANVDQHTQFFKLMGIDPALAQVINATPAETMRWLNADELKRYRVTTSAPSTR